MTPTTVAVIIIVCCTMICGTLIAVAKIFAKLYGETMKSMDKDSDELKLERFRHDTRRPRPPIPPRPPR